MIKEDNNRPEITEFDNKINIGQKKFSKEQIAHNQDEINQNTKVYVGELFPGIFDKLSTQIEHIYTSFSEKEIIRDTVTIGGETVQVLEQKLQKANVQIFDSAKEILNSDEFTTLETPEEIDLVILRVSDFGFKDFDFLPTTNQLYQRAKELGLELCPAEVGPHYRLKYTDQPFKECLYIGMKQIKDSCGNVFILSHYGDDGLRLDTPHELPIFGWLLDKEIVFRHRKLEP